MLQEASSVAHLGEEMRREQSLFDCEGHCVVEPSYVDIKPLDKLICDDDINNLKRAIQKIKPRDRELICRNFGIGANEPTTQVALSREHNCSPQAISKRLKRAVERLGVQWRISSNGI
ncbi:MAG: sigma-70 family RNA polymerase sigma factor [Planctomycetia bacterium]|nr:sigma-70 family RNA polymerase sigma factor [Planctomycetia bacterium]